MSPRSLPAGPASNDAERWLAMYEIFLSDSGPKLRMNIADTILIKDGRVAAWFYSARDGTVCRAPPADLNQTAIFQKLASSQSHAEASLNPQGFVALAHYTSGISRLLDQLELQHVLLRLSSHGRKASTETQDFQDTPFCIQGHIPPVEDMRFITSCRADDVKATMTCTTIAKRFSVRYAAPRSLDAASNPQSPKRLNPVEDSMSRLSADEVVLEAQLMALGLLDIPSTSDGALAAPAARDPTLSPSAEVRVEARALAHVLLDFLQQLHGLTVQQLVLEFVQPVRGGLHLLSVPAVEWATAASPSGKPSKELTGFTEQWSDFVAGRDSGPFTLPLGSQPQGQQPRKTTPSVMTSLGPAQTSPAGPGSRAAAPAGGPAARSHVESTAIYDVRPGSAPAVIVQKFRPQGFARSPAGSSAASSRIASKHHAQDVQDKSPLTYSLWAPRDGLSTDTVVGSLSLEIESLRQRLQQQTAESVQAEAALSQAAVRNKAATDQLHQNIEDLRAEVSLFTNSKLDREGEFERLRVERPDLRSEAARQRDELRQTKEALDAERAALATQIRESQSKESQMEEELRDLKLEHDLLTQHVSALTRRKDESREVVDALKSQLLDYRQMVTLLQSQTRRGKSKSATSGGGAAGPTGASKDVPMSLASLDESAMALLASTAPPSLGGAAAAPAISSRPNSATSQQSPNRAAGPGSILGQSTDSLPWAADPLQGSTASLYNSKILPQVALTAGNELILKQLQEIRKQRQLLEQSNLEAQLTASTRNVGAEDARAARLLAVREHEHWRPNYDSIVLADLFISGGEMLERMIPVHTACISVLQEVEDDLLDIYNFYSRIKRVRMREDKLIMFRDQFTKLAVEAGDMRPEDPSIEDVFQFMSDRTMTLSDVESDVENFISFELFPEAVARLAAAKYDWRVPMTDDEADTQIEMPSYLLRPPSPEAARTLDASPSSRSVGRPWLPAAPLDRGRSPSSRPRTATRSRPGSALGGAALLAKPGTPPGEEGLPAADKPPAGEHAAAEDDAIGAGQLFDPEQVLLKMIKTFIHKDLLVHARRGKTAGSLLSKQKVSQGERLVPPEVWAV